MKHFLNTFCAVAVFAPLVACDADRDRSGQVETGLTASPARPSASAPSPQPTAPQLAPSHLVPAKSIRRAPPASDDIRQAPIEEQRRHVLGLLREELGVGDSALQAIAEVFRASDWLSLGNPRISRPALSRAECQARRAGAKVRLASAECGAPNMVLVPAAGGGRGVCIDQFEFPNVACEFPVVWVRASEAARICSALGKRLCDAHEWEGACAGKVLDPAEDYAWGRLPKLYDSTPRRDRRLQMEHIHNESRKVVWAYGAKPAPGHCATSVRKDARCTTVDWGICPTQSFPAGSFPECASSVGVYDQHGNVAEHMSLPLFEKELRGRGDTEMKGSWFAFDYEAPHADDCRWRAKNWHTTRVDHFNSHRSYHLGFRCCKDLATDPD